MPQIAIIMGSDSDYKTVRPAIDILRKFGVEFEVNVMSAHRTPDIVAEYVKGLKDKGFKAVIAAAGKAAHLPGVVAASTLLPVIGVPISGSVLDGMDALLSIVQMPPGIPVATVGIDAGANAALLAITQMAAYDTALYDKLVEYRKDMADGVVKKHEALQKEIQNG